MVDRSNVLLGIIEQLRVSRNILTGRYFLLDSNAIQHRLPCFSGSAVRLDCTFLITLLTQSSRIDDRQNHVVGRLDGHVPPASRCDGDTSNDTVLSVFI